MKKKKCNIPGFSGFSVFSAISKVCIYSLNFDVREYNCGESGKSGELSHHNKYNK
jgi:hypothetical protein